MKKISSSFVACRNRRFPRSSVLTKGVLLLAAIGSRPCHAAVPADDITLQPPVRDNLTIISPNIGYGNTGAGTGQIPLYTPWDSGTPAWWDNLVQELLQGRISVVNLNNRGWVTKDGVLPTSGSGNMDPRRLTNFFDAAARAGVPNYFKAICMLDTAGVKVRCNQVLGVPGTNSVDMSIQSLWTDVWFKQFIEPWFDTVPSSAWYRINGKPVIHIWATGPSWWYNRAGNEALLLQSLEQQFNAKYGVSPAFIMTDSDVTGVSSIVGYNPWFSTTTGYNMTTYNGYTTGTLIAGYGNNPVVKARDSGATLRAGLDAAFNNKAALMCEEGWTNQVESMGIYRSKDAAWDYPNQYINIFQGFNDLRTVTLRLEAEGADAYSDYTTGNTGGAFRTDDLDVRTIPGANGGWAVGWTSAGEWIEFKGVNFSPGNYKFPIRYASPNANRHVRLLVDGVALPDVTLPTTGGTNTFDTIYLGQKTMTGGTHTLRVVFLDGGVDLDWLFIKKFDPMISLKASNNQYVSAEKGGGDVVVANRPTISNWEKFSADDINGGSLSDGDTIYLQTRNGLFLSAASGGGSALTADRRIGASYERFIVHTTNGSSGPVLNGYTIALESQDGHYLTVGSNNTLTVTGTSIAAPQTYTVSLSAQ